MSYTCELSLARYPAVQLLISTNFRTKPLAFNVNMRIRNLIQNFTYCLLILSVNINGIYSRKKRPKRVQSGASGGRYRGPPTTNPDIYIYIYIYITVTQKIHYLSTDMCVNLT